MIMQAIQEEVVEDVVERTSPLFQDTQFIIMWKSYRSGGTYSILRKSVEGKDRFIKTLDDMGINLESVTVTEVIKPWVPTRKTKPKTTSRGRTKNAKNVSEC
jgi:hypothetical protein